jgi:hypothetical protein
MPLADWNVPMILVTPQGELVLNSLEQVEGYYALDSANCKSGPVVRSSADSVPQGDGAILHPGFLGGYAVTLAVQYWAAETVAACATSDPSSDSMNDLLMRHLFAIKDGGGRLLYTPNGKPQRLLDRLALFGDSIDVTETPGMTGVSFQMLSQLPYSFDFTQIETVLDAGTPAATLTNDGSINYMPVVKVFGPTDGFQIVNLSALDQFGNPQRLAYDAGLPGAVPIGAGDYVEFAFFENTAFLNGNGADRMAGVDIVASDFWPLVVGDNAIQITGDGTDPAPETHVLWQSAWL